MHSISNTVSYSGMYLNGTFKLTFYDLNLSIRQNVASNTLSMWKMTGSVSNMILNLGDCKPIAPN